MSFGGAFGTYMSCNKAGAIPQFQTYLQQYPHDFNARMLLASSHAIVGNNAKAIEEYKKAASLTSSPPEKISAISQMERLSGNIAYCGAILKSGVLAYPTSAPVNYYYGQHLESVDKPQKAIPYFTSASNLGYGKVSYVNFQLAEIYWNQSRLAASETYQYYKKATDEIPEMTIGYLGMLKCWLASKDAKTEEGRKLAHQYFTTAQKLNPKLVPPEIQYNQLRVLDPGARYPNDNTHIIWKIKDVADLCAVDTKLRLAGKLENLSDIELKTVGSVLAKELQQINEEVGQQIARRHELASLDKRKINAMGYDLVYELNKLWISASSSTQSNKSHGNNGGHGGSGGNGGDGGDDDDKKKIKIMIDEIYGGAQKPDPVQATKKGTKKSIVYIIERTFEQGWRDFDHIVRQYGDPDKVNYYPGEVKSLKLKNGITVTFRKRSNDGRPTMEFSGRVSKPFKIRYTEE